MPINNESLNVKLYELLKTKGYNPVPMDSKGERTPVAQEADIFKFNFIKDGVNYGEVWVTINNAQNVAVYYDDEVADSPSDNTSGTEYTDSWTGFLNHLKNWSQRRQLSFELKNKDHLANDMAQREYMKKENMFEGYYPMGKKASYSDNVPNVKIILQHTRQIEEGEQRYRNIAKIFVENTQGERFALPTNKPGLARVYARHIAEGGTPYDERGRHITSLVEEYTKMAGFVRATKGKQFNESAQRLINEGISHYQSLKEQLHKMVGHRGYTAYFESWTPALMEEQEDQTDLNELFVQETIDPRIESVMPILSKLQKKVSEMKEIKALESWADDIINEKMDSTTTSLAVPADEMLEDIDTGEHDARKTTPSSKEEQEKVFAKHRERMKNLDEAPGAETLAHNQNTEKSNLKAFDLAEGDERPYVCVHATKGTHECKASSSYEAVKKAAQHWKLKSTAGIDAHLADKEVTITEQDRSAKLFGQAIENEDQIKQVIKDYLKIDRPSAIESVQAAIEMLADRPKSSLVNSLLSGLAMIVRKFKMPIGKHHHGLLQHFVKEDSDMKHDDSHGSPYDRGSADAYYGRAKDPHKYPSGSYRGEKVKLTDPKDIEAYMAGYEGTTDRKKWDESKDIEEDLDANQKRVGQLGPTEKAKNISPVLGKSQHKHPFNGKLVGANESVEHDPLDELKRLLGK